MNTLYYFSLLFLMGAIEAFLITFLVWHLPSMLSRHIITFHTSTSLQPSSLAWDPTAQRFIVGSITGPTIHAISDSGAVEHLLSEPSLTAATSAATSVAVDHIRRRLIVLFSNPTSIAAYDMKSYGRIFIVPLPEMDTAPGGVAVDLRSGEAFVSSSKRGVVWKVGQKGAVRVLSECKIYGDQGLGGIVHVSHGYLLVLQPVTGKIFKVDSDNGAVKEVLNNDTSARLAPACHVIALHLHTSVVVGTSQTLHLIRGEDSWSTAGVYEESKVEERMTAVAVTMRDDQNAYMLVKLQKGYRIQKVLWDTDWTLVVGMFGLSMFFMFLGFSCTGNLLRSGDLRGYQSMARMYTRLVAMPKKG